MEWDQVISLTLALQNAVRVAFFMPSIFAFSLYKIERIRLVHSTRT